MQDLLIKNWKLISGVNGLQGTYVTQEEIGRQLGYENPNEGVGKIHMRHREAFKEGVDTLTVKVEIGGKTYKVRVFSERGTLKVIRYSDMQRADEIMDEVFDVFMEAKKKTRKSDLVAQEVIDRYLLDKPEEWTKLFPERLGKAVFQMYGLGEYKSGKMSLPMANFVAQYIYEAAPDGIYETLLERNPGKVGNRKFKHHQFFTDDAKAWLRNHITSVETLIRVSNYTCELFKELFTRMFPHARFQNLLTSSVNVNIPSQTLFDFVD